METTITLPKNGTMEIQPEMFITIWISGTNWISGTKGKIEVGESWNDDKRKKHSVKTDEDGKWFFKYKCKYEEYGKGKKAASVSHDYIVYLGNAMSTSFAKTTNGERIQIANVFSSVLHDWLTVKQMLTVIKRNKNYKYDPSVCASHDFCDANMAMDEAFTKIMKREFNLQSSEDCSTFNHCWELAKKNDFRKIEYEVGNDTKEFFELLIKLTGTYFLSDYVENISDHLTEEETKALVKKRDDLKSECEKVGLDIHDISISVGQKFLRKKGVIK